jgi:hypothetical protein
VRLHVALAQQENVSSENAAAMLADRVIATVAFTTKGVCYRFVASDRRVLF